YELLSADAGSMNLTALNQTDLCFGFSCPERSVSPVYVLLYVCAAAVVLLTVCGNLLVIISVCHFKQLHTPTNMLILSLAASDFLVGLFVLPFQLSRLTESCWVFGPTLCVFYIFISFFVTSISIYNVALIAVDRYFAISNPFLYTEKVSVNTASCVVILCNWFVLLSYNSSLLYFNGNAIGLILCPDQCLVVLNEVWSLVDLLVVFVLPCSVIIIFYLLIFIIAKKHASAIRELNLQSNAHGSKNTADSMKSERKAAKVLSILVAVFLACLFPYFVNTLVSNAVETASFHNLVILLYLNSTINPVIYALFYPWFRRCTKVILTLRIFRTDSALMKVL
uniref:G-protein coupled receptors family 1 profile domain-containing protein n=1 Tax=Pygocentrus nattereri TaxID=42514 RepID=A0A3B4CYC9_PYGNA